MANQKMKMFSSMKNRDPNARSSKGPTIKLAPPKKHSKTEKDKELESCDVEHEPKKRIAVSDLTDHQLAEIKRAFTTFDCDNSGSIDVEELQALMQSMGENLTTAELNDVIASFDNDNSGSIEFPEFIELIRSRFDFSPLPKWKRKRKKSTFELKRKRNTDQLKLLSEEMLQEIRGAFNLFDKSNRGFVKIKNLGRLMRALGRNPTEMELTDVTNQLNDDEIGVFNFDDFLDAILGKFEFFACPLEEMEDIFSVFDKDGSGLIDVEEFREVLMKNGEHTLEEVDEYFGIADINKDGQLDYYEVARMMSATMLKDL